MNPRVLLMNSMLIADLVLRGQRDRILLVANFP